MGFKTLLLVSFAICMLNLNTNAQRVKDGKWLIGTWENKTKKGTTYECWSKISDTELTGRSYLIKGNDTIILETLRLVQEQHGIFYIPTVTQQNKGLPVKFALKKMTGDYMEFENPEHDFPQMITYRKISPDSLIAEISGTLNGQTHTRQFGMKRSH